MVVVIEPYLHFVHSADSNKHYVLDGLVLFTDLAIIKDFD